jgi:Tfp pilus assembly protein PilF
MLRPHSLICLCLLSVAVAISSGCNSMAARAGNNKGVAYFNRGEYAEAREEFRRAVADTPQNPDYVSNFATASKRLGDIDQARQSYRQALRLDPSHQPTYHGLASLYLETGRADLATSLIQGWVETQPYEPKAHIQMAWLQREMGNHAAAEESLHAALKLNPNHPVAQAQLGQIYQDSGRSQEALAMYQSSLMSDWSQPEVHARVTQLNPQPMERERIPQTAYTAQPMMARQAPTFPLTQAAHVWEAPPGQPGPTLAGPMLPSPGLQQAAAIIPAEPHLLPETAQRPPQVEAH